MIKLKKLILYILTIATVTSFAPSRALALSKPGSTGSEVREIQTRLKNWDYYTGAVDGIYGSATTRAVMRFQANHGLTPDGIAGAATLSKMGISSSTSSSSNSYQQNVELLARIINGEARGEPYEGQVAV